MYQYNHKYLIYNNLKQGILFIQKRIKAYLLLMLRIRNLNLNYWYKDLLLILQLVKLKFTDISL